MDDRGDSLLAFIESQTSRNPDLIMEMEKEALEEGIPIIRPMTQSLIKFLLEMKKPQKILEVGTGTGFSASLMHVFAPEAGITTIERDEARIRRAKENFAKLSGKPITLLEGDAADILKELPAGYDLIFMDAAKGQYIHFYDEVKRLLLPGAVLISDNIFKEGEIPASRFAVKRRNRTIHKRMREYLERLTRDPELVTILLQEGDGAALSVRKEQE